MIMTLDEFLGIDQADDIPKLIGVIGIKEDDELVLTFSWDSINNVNRVSIPVDITEQEAKTMRVEEARGKVSGLGQVVLDSSLIKWDCVFWVSDTQSAFMSGMFGYWEEIETP